MEKDKFYMERALELAAKGIGTTSPNPPVGAVIVGQGNTGIIGEGFHEQAGRPHAERQALADARARGHAALLKGATIYVTLEPCSSFGRTPPCTEGIIEAGIARVVFGSTDPDKRHQGRAVELLQAAGLQVTDGVMQDACDRLLRPWRHATEQGRPWVLAKAACTLDARMTRRTERWLSGQEALSYAHGIRVQSDAILVGGNTVRTDNPALTIRTPDIPVPAIKKQPWRVVLTNHADTLPRSAKIFTDEHAGRTLVFERVDDFRCVLERLYRERGVVQLMLECGGSLLRRFLEQDLIDEWVQILTPTLGGGPAEMLPGGFLPTEHRFLRGQLIPCGNDIILRGILEKR